MTDSKDLDEFARQMRKNPSPAERILWGLVRNHRLAGYRFRRQEKCGPYILDFYCAVANLVVELDGESHFGRGEYDRRRDEYLAALGLFVLRFLNSQVFDEQEAVLELIAQTCAQRGAANAKVLHKIDADGRFHSNKKKRRKA